MKKNLSLTKIIFGIILIILIALPIVSGIGIEVMKEESMKISRGMTLFFTSLILLVALPFFNKQFASIILFLVALGLARGFIRVAEQDIVRTYMSMIFGLKFGLKLLIPLVLANIIIVILFWIFGSLIKKDVRTLENIPRFKKVKTNLSEKQIALAMDYGVKKGFRMKEIIKALKLKGASLNQINNSTYLAEVRTRKIFEHFRNALICQWIMLITSVITLLFLIFDFFNHKEKEFTIYLSLLFAIILICFALMKINQKKEKEIIQDIQEMRRI